MRREVSSTENFPVQATGFTGKFASFGSGLGSHFPDNLLVQPLSRLSGGRGRGFFSLHTMI